MMKDISWGTKIAIGASVYVIGILSFVAFSTTQKINLVAKDYYPQQIVYEAKINKIKNTQLLVNKIIIENNNTNIKLTIPSDLLTELSGKITFYRPADYELDVTTTINTNKDGIQFIETDNLKTGRYSIQIDWKSNGIEYYQEENIYLNK